MEIWAQSAKEPRKVSCKAHPLPLKGLLCENEHKGLGVSVVAWGGKNPDTLLSSFFPRTKCWGEATEVGLDGKASILQRETEQDPVRAPPQTRWLQGPKLLWRLTPRLFLKAASDCRSPSTAPTEYGSLESQV